jgi:hypothetical protein
LFIAERVAGRKPHLCGIHASVMQLGEALPAVERTRRVDWLAGSCVHSADDPDPTLLRAVDAHQCSRRDLGAAAAA